MGVVMGSHWAEEQPRWEDRVHQLQPSLVAVKAQASLFFSSIIR